MSLEVKDLSENERDFFEERAAIMEEGNKGMTRREAERRALLEVEKKRKLF
jgi:hypothetical protein